MNPSTPAKAEGTLHILAVMVEFQPDTNQYTSGDGTFGTGSLPYLENNEIFIDPLPHDKKYFEAHLEFARNYFSKMSDNSLDIQYQVIDNIYQLPEKMENYSPIGENPGSEPLADLARDAWQKLGSDGSLDISLTPNDEIAFVIFHAGVGRDIELTGTILEKTPQDIPSVYLSQDALGRLFDDPSFSGFPIHNGDLLVDHTIIVPRTLTRVGEDISGAEVVLPLSLNGMITAQIGSHIGLPDLFNTETGESGIGRFGLMDGAGIFAYNGLFPPELSAWEKIHMGWSTPFDIDKDDGEITLPAASLGQPNSIGKISISASEYFLVENRHREADETGTTLTIQPPDGSEPITQTFTNTDTAFVFQQSDFSELLEPGVVIDVSNYDFALPGGPAEVLEETEDDDGRILNGGFLIWHIDEGIIQNQLAARNGINDDPRRRGVNLVEADGAQDIGRPTAIGFFENEVNGSAFDFWWSGNDASVITQSGTITLYENRFGPDTTPDNSSNSGAPSFFELLDFSDYLPQATFQIREAQPNDDLYAEKVSIHELPLSYFTPGENSYWSRYPLSTFSYSAGQQNLSFYPANDGMMVYDFNENELTDPLQLSVSSIQQPFFNAENNLFSIAPNPGQEEDNFTAELFEWVNGSNNLLWSFESEPNRGFISSPGQDILQFDGTTGRASIQSQTYQADFYSEPRQSSEQINDFGSEITNDGTITFNTPEGSETSQILPGDDPFSREYVGLIEHQDDSYQTYLLTDHNFYLYNINGSEVERSQLFSTEEILEWPSLVDFDENGFIDVIVVNRETNEIQAKNINGASLPGFPVNAPSDVSFLGTPLVADLDGDGEQEIVITGRSQNSINIYAYGSDGRLMDGFPLLTGGADNAGNDIVHPSFNGQNLTAVSPQGDLRIWNFPNLQNTLWGSKYGNSGNNKITGRQIADEVSEPDFGVLNTAETYNWPNPAKDETYLRFQTSSPGDVQIKITTTSGRLLYNRTVESRGNVPEEILIDTSGWGSGGYLAVITASVNGQKERKLVKIAIAK